MENFKNKFLSICSLAGIYYSTKFAFQGLYFLQKNFLTFSSDLKKKYGDGWVVVTGGSEGIGLALAKKFAIEGFKIILISRDQDKLDAASKLIKEAANDAIVVTISFDCNKEYRNDEINEIGYKLNEYINDICVLINNVGCIHRAPIADMPNEKIRSMLNLNINALVFITQHILSAMVKRDKRSLIIGSGSMAGLVRFPTRSVYASTKIFMKSFLATIAQEYSHKIDCTYLTIGSVATALNPLQQPFRIAPDDLAKNAYKMVGKYGCCAGHYVHEWQYFLYGNAPLFLQNKFRDYLGNMHKKI